MHEYISSGQSVVLVSIVGSSGSTPRGAGARMIVYADGSFGTIGGGAVEYQSQRLAKELITGEQSCVKGFSLSADQAADLGMICGGDMAVAFQYFAGGNVQNLGLISRIVGLFDRDVNSWIITDISNETAWGMAVYVQGEGLFGADNIKVEDILPLLDAKSVWSRENGKSYYVEPLVRSGRVCIFGGGHVAQELVPVLTNIGFRCVVMDDRPEFAAEKLFPQAGAIYLGDFANIEASLQIGADDYVVIMTRGHQYDYTVLVQALRTEAYYIGMIGSKSKVAATFAKLINNDGFTQDDFSRVYTPIGLDIQAESPAEIAISIAAQLIEVRADKK